MQRIMIVSDTHRRLYNLADALSREDDIDLLIHLGDFEGDDDAIEEMAGCKVELIAGNNDYYTLIPGEKEIEIAGRRVLLTHGHYYYVSLDLATIRKEAVSRGYDIVMFGHTHRPVIEVGDDVTLINPGSISYPRQNDKKCTYILMEIDDDDQVKYTLKSVN